MVDSGDICWLNASKCNKKKTIKIVKKNVQNATEITGIYF